MELLRSDSLAAEGGTMTAASWVAKSSHGDVASVRPRLLLLAPAHGQFGLSHLIPPRDCLVGLFGDHPRKGGRSVLPQCKLAVRKERILLDSIGGSAESTE